MKIGIISGSHRPNSQSAKIARYIERTLQQQQLCDAAWVYELADNPLPLWDEGVWNPEDAAWQELLQPLREQLHSCDGLIIISPEWHGMATPGLKNFLLMWTGGEEIAHKPALIVTVSVADGGSYPVAELRMSSYKNSRICYLPEHLIIRYVDTVFNADASTNNASAQEYFEARLNYCLEMLREYSLAFRQIRSSGKVSLSAYSSGM